MTRLTAPDLGSVGIGAIPASMLLPAQSFYEHCRKTREDRAAAAVGGVYAVRALRWRSSDLGAVQEILEKDEYGVTIAWKVLETFPPTARRRP